jgi:hypothetical protein
MKLNVPPNTRLEYAILSDKGEPTRGHLVIRIENTPQGPELRVHADAWGVECVAIGEAGNLLRVRLQGT